MGVSIIYQFKGVRKEMKVIQCPFCMMEVDEGYFFAHIDTKHEVKEINLENFNRRMTRIGVDPVEPYEKEETEYQEVVKEVFRI